MSRIGNREHFSVLIVASRGKRHSTLSDIKPWAAEECSGFGVLLPLTAGGIAEAARAGAVSAFRELRICQGLWRGSPGHREGRGSCSSHREAVSTWPDLKPCWAMGIYCTLCIWLNVLPASSWAVLRCSACRAGTSPCVSAHVCTSAMTLVHWQLSYLTAQLWPGPLAGLPQPGQMPSCFYCWKGKWSILGRTTRWLCVSAV